MLATWLFLANPAPQAILWGCFAFFAVSSEQRLARGEPAPTGFDLAGTSLFGFTYPNASSASAGGTAEACGCHDESQQAAAAPCGFVQTNEIVQRCDAQHDGKLGLLGFNAAELRCLEEEAEERDCVVWP